MAFFKEQFDQGFCDGKMSILILHFVRSIKKFVILMNNFKPNLVEVALRMTFLSKHMVGFTERIR